MNPIELDWNKIALELKKKLNRNPRSIEIQMELTKRYWSMIDIIEKNRLKDND
jgi:hypothetical protein